MGRRLRRTKTLPQGWTRAQAEEFDRVETAKVTASALTGDALIDEAVEHYKTYRVPKLKHDPSLEIEHIDYKGRRVAELRQVCAEYRRSAKVAPATIKNRLRYLISAVRFWWKDTMPPIPDPADGVLMPEVRNERHCYVGRREMLLLARACRLREVRAAIRIAFYSGMRLGEIQRAQIEGGTFVLQDTKNGSRRVIPVHPRVRCCLHYKTPPKHSVWYHFDVARRQTGIDINFHDLRHSAASEMVNAGVDLYAVGAVLGHKSAQSTKRYAHLRTQYLADAVSTIGRKLPEGQGRNWRRGPESNRTNRICNGEAD